MLAKLDYVEATLALVLQQIDVMLASSRSAIARYRTVGDTLGIAFAQMREAQALLHLGRIVEAQATLREALTFARAAGNRWLTGTLLRCVGTTSLAQGDSDAAYSNITEAVQCYFALGSERDVGWAVYDLSLVDYFCMADAGLALRHATDALATFRRFDHTRGIAITLNMMATYLASMTRYAEAKISALEVLDLAGEHHWDVLAALALQQLASIAALQAQSSRPAYAPAARILGFVDARRAALGSPRHQHEKSEYKRLLDALHEAIGVDAVVRLMVEGASLTQEQVVEEALAI